MNHSPMCHSHAEDPNRRPGARPEPRAAGSAIGTLAWARRTGGRLSPRKRQHVQRELVEQQALALAQRNDRVRDKIRHLDLDAVPLPDSALAKRAERHAAELSSEPLLNHCYRTYLWGSLLAQADDAAVDDPELLYVASLLHDLGATDRHFGKDRRAHCFAVEGGFAAEAFLLEEGCDRGAAEGVAEAIILHINAAVEAERGFVALYLSLGAWCDMQGRRASDIPVATARRVLHRYPGLDVGTAFSAFVMREIALRPESRVAANAEATGGGAPVFYPWAELERGNPASDPGA